MVKFLKEVIDRLRWMSRQDRIGPDLPVDYWRLHLKSTMRALCKKKFAKFSENAEFRAGAYAIFCSQISIGKRVVLRPGTMLFSHPNSHITIEDDVILGSGVHIYLANHKFNNPTVPIIDQDWSEAKPVILKRGCWIGAGAIILPGVTIGENAVVGAGSVVTKDVAPATVVAGNPVRLIRQITSKERND